MAKKKLPGFIKPMLASLIEEPFDNPEWLFEIKWDGYRALAYIDKNVQLISRNANSFNSHFPLIVKDLSRIKSQVILDGEIVILDSNGKSNFQLMQNYLRYAKGDLAYYVFDLLFLNGNDLRDLPLLERKAMLKNLLDSARCSYVHYSDHIVNKGKLFFKEAEKKGLEGIMAKKMESVYSSSRSKEWLKIKTHKRQEVVIAGFTEPRGSRKYFGALLLGVYHHKELIYVGHVGGGFNQKLLADVYSKIKPLVQQKCPFKIKPKTNTPAVWLKPKLVGEIEFGEWTQDGKMRQPIFQGLRMDKKPSEVKREESLAVTGKKKVKVDRNDEVQLSNLDKIYWPKLNYTKGDLIDYYRNVSDFILPFLINRPVMIRRFPEGVEGISFIQKDTKNLNLPSWVKTIKIEHEHKNLTYFLVQDLRTLEYIVNLGTVEFHPFLSPVSKPEYPNYFVMDLDPESIDFQYVIETAKAIHNLLEKIEVNNLIKTSGKRGLHICIPMANQYTYEQALQFGEIIARYIHEQLPDITSLIRQPAKRQKKVYIDVLQNHYKQTVISPYSARGTDFATVSTPLKWSEVKKGLDPNHFTIQSVPKRLAKIGDFFASAMGKGINLKRTLDMLQEIMKRRDLNN